MGRLNGFLTKLQGSVGSFTFSRWSDGDTSASRTVTVNGDMSLTAYFTKTTSGGESSETNPDGGDGNLGD